MILQACRYCIIVFYMRKEDFEKKNIRGLKRCGTFVSKCRMLNFEKPHAPWGVDEQGSRRETDTIKSTIVKSLSVRRLEFIPILPLMFFSPPHPQPPSLHLLSPYNHSTGRAPVDRIGLKQIRFSNYKGATFDKLPIVGLKKTTTDNWTTHNAITLKN
jgi:hypothetical protein